MIVSDANLPICKLGEKPGVSVAETNSNSGSSAALRLCTWNWLAGIPGSLCNEQRRSLLFQIDSVIQRWIQGFFSMARKPSLCDNEELMILSHSQSFCCLSLTFMKEQT